MEIKETTMETATTEQIEWPENPAPNTFSASIRLYAQVDLTNVQTFLHAMTPAPQVWQGSMALATEKTLETTVTALAAAFGGERAHIDLVGQTYVEGSGTWGVRCSVLWTVQGGLSERRWDHANISEGECSYGNH